MKMYIADSASTGENFVYPLGLIREVLERYIVSNTLLVDTRLSSVANKVYSKV